MAGNVQAWVADPLGVLRGGSWYDYGGEGQSADPLTTWARVEVAPSYAKETVGFRCVVWGG